MSIIDQYLREISNMSETGQLTNEQTQRLLILSLTQIAQSLNAIETQNNEFLKRLVDIERYTAEYPSLTFLFAKQPRKVIAFVLTVFFILSLLVASGLRETIFAVFGLP